MKYLICIITGAFLLLAHGSFAQSSQAYSSNNASAFAPKEKEGKSARKSRVKRSKKTYKAAGRNKTGLFAKKKKSDCDCPGSPKAKRKKKR